MIRVMLVDDHPLWREMLRKVLVRSGAAEVVAEAADGDEALSLVAEAAPHVVVMDIDLPTIDGIETTRRVLDARPRARVLVLSGTEDRTSVIGAVQAGASGYMTKTVGAAEVTAAVERIHAGELVFPPALADLVLREFRSRGAVGEHGRPPTVTLLFTDIEGSTALSERAGAGWSDTLREYRDVIRAACSRRGGREVSAQGDECVWVFARAGDAVRAAVAVQRSLAEHPWAAVGHLRARIGLHTGEPDVIDDGYEGADLSRAARICCAGHGGQVVVSEVTRHLAGAQLPDGTALQALGTYRLRGFSEPERLHQLTIDGLPGDFPELRPAHLERVDVGGRRG